MADKKISALTGATTPLDGTEVLPIVQGSATVKVANNDLRPKQIQSNATSGVLQVAGPETAATRVMTTPDANFTVARTDAAQSLTGDQTLSTGNLVIGTSGKGIDFSATPGTGTSELLADYEEGTWVMGVSFGGGATGVSYTNNTGFYTKVGNIVHVSGYLTLSSKGSSTGSAKITGLPFTINGSVSAYAAASIWADALTYSGTPTLYGDVGGTTIQLAQLTDLGVGSLLSDANLANNSRFMVSFTYRAA